MINKFKIWFNRKDTKILIAIIIIIVFYLMTKGLNIYYKNLSEERKQEEKKSNKVENTYFDNSEESITNLGFTEISSEEEECVKKVIDIILTSIYKAHNTNNNENIKKSIYNMMTRQFIATYSYTYYYEKVDVENQILDFIPYVEDTNYFSIGKIYKYSENNNVVRYMVKEQYRNGVDEENRDMYMIVNLDYNNNTFSYDGNLNDIDVDNISNFKEINEIMSNGDNKFYK